MSLYDYKPEELEQLWDIVDEIIEGIRDPRSVFDDFEDEKIGHVPDDT